MCAAPGGKTTQLAAIMKNKGCIYAVEQNSARFEILAKRKILTNSTIVKLFNQDVLTITHEQMPNVQYIMIDPSCSGSGMIDQLLRFDENKKPDGLYNLAGLQMKILSYAMGTFKNAEKIVYSTCSIYPEENEEVVQRCLEMCPHWELIKPLEFAEKWKNFGSPKYKHIGKKCIYAKPEIDFTNGFFVAVFQRRNDVQFDYDANRLKHWTRGKATGEKYQENAYMEYDDDEGGENYTETEDDKTTDIEYHRNDEMYNTVENSNTHEIISKNDQNQSNLIHQSNEMEQSIIVVEKVETKKKKKNKTKTIETNSNVVDENNFNEKKRKRNDSEEMSKNEMNELNENDQLTEKVKTKKKKKNKEKAINENVGDSIEIEIDAIENVTSKNDIKQSDEIEQINEVKKKKKKKNKEKMIEEEIIDKEKEKSNQIDDLVIKKKEKKKKKHSHDNE